MTVAVLAGVLCGMPAYTSPAQDAESAEDARLRQMNSLDAVEKRDIRDPFWPVGFYPEWWRQPAAKDGSSDGAEVRPDQWAEAMKQVKVSGMSRMGNSGFFAVVNGRTVTEGDTVSVMLDGKTYRWAVTEIGEKGLKLAPSGE